MPIQVAKRQHWFWLVNAALLLLYGWTLTETVAITVRIANGQCTAVFQEPFGERTSQIPCPGVRGGQVGLYSRTVTQSWLEVGPLDRLFHSTWHSVYVTVPGQPPQKTALDNAPPEQRKGGTAIMQWAAPQRDFTVTAEIRRPRDEAGILLLNDLGDGWLFLTTPQRRQGVWWRWEDGQPAAALTGIPFQEAPLAQFQSLLRYALHGQQAGLLLLLLSWLGGELLKRMSLRKQPFWRLLQLRLTTRFSAHLIVGSVMLLVLALALFIAATVLQKIPHVQDSITYLFQAQTLARGHLWAPAPPSANAFTQEFLLIKEGRWFGKYPPGFPLVLALGVLCGQPWIINPLLAALTIPLLYGLGKRLYGRSTALLGIVLALVSPFFLVMSGSFMAHSAELFWMTLFMWAWMIVLSQQERQWRWVLLAGVALGMGFLTRQVTAVAIALPFMGITIWPRTWSGSWQPLLRKLMGVGLVTLPLVLLLPAYQWAITGNPLQDPRLLYWPFDKVGFGPDVGMSSNAFHLTTVTGETFAPQTVIDWYTDETMPPRGHTVARGFYNTEQNWQALERQLFGWPPFLTLSFVWLAFLLRRPTRADWTLLAIITALTGIYVTFWASGIMYGPRYYFAALPAFWLLTARGIQVSVRWLGTHRAWILSALCIGLVLGNLVIYLPSLGRIYHDYNFVTAQYQAEIERSVSGQAIIFIDTLPQNWWEYGSFFSGNTPWLDGRILYARDLGAEANARLLAYYPDYKPYYWHHGELFSAPSAELFAP